MANARHFSFLSDGIYDNIVTKQEVVYVLILGNSVTAVYYISLETVENADAEGLSDQG